MTSQPKIFVGKCRGGFAVFAGKSKLSTTHKTTDACEQDYQDNKAEYHYWAGSASVSIENSIPVVVSLY